MTTNNYDKHDKALIRSGRVDKKIEFIAINHQQMQLLVRRFYARVTSDSESDIPTALAEQLHKEG